MATCSITTEMLDSVEKLLEDLVSIWEKFRIFFYLTVLKLAANTHKTFFNPSVENAEEDDR